jgi:hypothetical protein
MKLHELAVPNSAQQVAQVFESYFGSRVTIEQLKLPQARYLQRRVKHLIREHKATPDRHFGERDPAYLKLLMLEQALDLKVKEEAIPVTAPATTSAGAKPAKTVNVKDPKLAAALKKSQSGQNLTPDEQKLVAGQALMNTESQLRRTMDRFKQLTESEVQQAQVVLAAQDMVDNIQSMIEDATEMQFKELPALVDSIRNQIGMDQAVQFQQDATAALSGLVQNLQGTKTSLEQGLGVVTGQQQMAPGLDAAMGGEPPLDAEAPMEPAADGGEDIDLSLDANLDDTDEKPAASRLGRERR